MTAPKHSIKRRRLSASLSQKQSSTDLTTTASPKILTVSNVKNNTTCVSCHRSLNATQGYLILCSRCSIPTCAVCSRTCNASVSSMPPTPHFIWSSSHSPTVPSPRRMALTLNSANTSLRTSITPVSGGDLIGKRRKFTDDDDGIGGRNFQERSDVEDRDQEVLPGCGRVICRNCCLENSQQNTITCYDCYGH